MESLSLSRPHPLNPNQTISYIDIDGPYSDGQYLIEIENHYKDHITYSVTREELEKIGNWINQQLSK
jgi:hypothetical protein